MPRLCTVILLTIALAGCAQHDYLAGDITRGRHLIYSYNCGACHVIPGVAEAKGTVGPTLAGFGSRNFIAGSVKNLPDNLSRWIREPQQIDAATAMPNLGITAEQATHIAAYLYTLR
jgi:cytochrome c